MVHLLAGALWLGGLLWLVAISRQAGTLFPVEAKRVSSAALVGVIAILLSGLVQTRFFLNTPGDLVHTGYGRLALLKMIGVVVLIGFGAYNRFGVLPRLDDSHARPKLARSIRQEILIMIVLILIGGFLAYVPTPPALQSSLAEFTEGPK
jgi:copper transport protein